MGLSVGVGAGPVRYSKSIRMGSSSGLIGSLVSLFVVMCKLGLLVMWWTAVAMRWLVVVLPVRGVRALRASQQSRVRQAGTRA